MTKEYKNISNEFYLMPKLFFIDEDYKDLDSDSILLYTILLDKTMNLSETAGWVDDEGSLYVIAPVKDLQIILNCSTYKIAKIKKELVAYDLISVVRGGISEYDKIYVKQIN
ncbi:replication initiator protein A [Salinicoccus kekensis]|uniref:replication initiator protein A n=1 Tax=Salinicoccus kekensis TaxID=714307 RepID=UPI00117A5A3C|nr:replication initiator protein A [Salinicoccus kekensis]